MWHAPAALCYALVTSARGGVVKIFVSWSGPVSQQVADALKGWLPKVLPKLDADDVFLSSSDIDPGDRWMSRLDEVLESTDYGILCLTRENMNAAWILYEAGALSKHFKDSRVTPLLIGLDPGDLKGPLLQRNASGVSKPEVLKLARALNSQMRRSAMKREQLDTVFEARWGELEPVLREAVARAGDTAAKYSWDVFLSAPMAAYPDDASYVPARLEVKKIFDALKGECGLRVYWAAEKIERLADFETIDVSVTGDVRALEASRYFVLIYPQKLPSSALFEAGYACALERPSHYFVRERHDLPFLMRELPGALSHVRIHQSPDDWTSYDDIARRLCRQRDAWFPR
ncbi:MAG TPA: TIR domain-containing protein [Myxococcales bacterium]